jgi:hypothetical protein
MKSKPSGKKSAPRSRRRSRNAPDPRPGLPTDPRLILKKLATLPIQTWSYKKDDPRTRHIGPMAQDFSAAFGVGDHHGIRVSDALGVAYASIQALHEIIRERAETIRSLRQELRRAQAAMRRFRSRRRKPDARSG